MVAGAIKGFNFTMDYALYEISYANITLLSASIPTYIPKDERTKGDDEVINADDPASQQRILELFGNIE